MLALVLLGGALLAVLAVSTPWTPLAGRPGPTVGADPARDFTDAELRREDRYHREVRRPAYAGLAAGLAAAAVLGLTPLGARLVEAAARPLGGGALARATAGGIAVSLVVMAVRLPFRAATEVVLRRYGLSTQTWSSWALDVLRGSGVTVAVVLVALSGFYGLVRVFPGSWWLPVGLGGAALVFAASFLYPRVVEPVFNDFTPMADGALRTSLIELAERDGVPITEVLVADASRRTTALNAYVSGYGRTHRIVVYDTLLTQATPDEIRLIVAHELGHSSDRDVLKGTALGALGVAVAATGGFLVLSWAPLVRRAGTETAGDPRSVALLLLLVSVAGLLTTPLQSLVSRRVEARADVHALDLTRDPATAAAMQRRLSVTNLSDLDPHPLVYGMFSTHPTGPERIALARTWAERAGVPVPRSLVPAPPVP